MSSLFMHVRVLCAAQRKNRSGLIHRKNEQLIVFITFHCRIGFVHFGGLIFFTVDFVGVC